MCLYARNLSISEGQQIQRILRRSTAVHNSKQSLTCPQHQKEKNTRTRRTAPQGSQNARPYP